MPRHARVTMGRETQILPSAATNDWFSARLSRSPVTLAFPPETPLAQRARVLPIANEVLVSSPRASHSDVLAPGEYSCRMRSSGWFLY